MQQFAGNGKCGIMKQYLPSLALKDSFQFTFYAAAVAVNEPYAQPKCTT